MTTEVPFVPPPAPPVSNTPEPISLEDQEAKDRARFHELKAQALQDPGLKTLKDKADNAAGDATRDAEKAYDKALFKKVREMDPSISDYLDRLEAATMKRLDGNDGQ